MNISGPPIAEQAKRADHLFILHDSIDHKIGKISVVHGASARGHNGIKSIREAYNRPFWSVRLGIGRPSEGEDLADYVLGKLSVRELDHWYTAGVGLVASALEVPFRYPTPEDLPSKIRRSHIPRAP
jgi:PTH1 family peptidyl-tRNA hydrolase